MKKQNRHVKMNLIQGKFKFYMLGGILALGILMTSFTALVIAESDNNDVDTITVRPDKLRGWSTADTRPGGAVNFIGDSTTPAGKGALQLTTTAQTTAKAQFMHASTTPIAQVSKLSYYTKQGSAPFPGADASYQLPAFLNGATGFTTFVFEPYENGTVVNNIWQHWNVTTGHFWSSKSVTCSHGAVVAGHGGAPFYTLSDIKTICPEAVVIGFGVNIGSNNPGYNVEADLVTFNNTTYNFEPAHKAQDSDKEQVYHSHED
ncbi:MAG TPA: hypothetical protein VNX65_04550 [Patescibacteria group bacterium]|jgi:hypothetical protein|nr:hypothetical protein [Patescibacteria group bacterium]